MHSCIGTVIGTVNMHFRSPGHPPVLHLQLPAHGRDTCTLRDQTQPLRFPSLCMSLPLPSPRVLLPPAHNAQYLLQRDITGNLYISTIQDGCYESLQTIIFLCMSTCYQHLCRFRLSTRVQTKNGVQASTQSTSAYHCCSRILP